MTPHFCCVCGRLAPHNGVEHAAGDWFRVDRDGCVGPKPSVWICGTHRDDVEAVVRALR